MGLLSNLISKTKKSEVEELFIDIKKESKLFEEFLRKHEEKISVIKEVIPAWNKGNIPYISVMIRRIFEFNLELKDLIQKILKLGRKDKKLLLFILKEKLNQIPYPPNMMRPNRSRINPKVAVWVKKLEDDFKQLFDFLRMLSEHLDSQNKTIEAWGKTGAAILAKDISEKRTFYRLLVYESHLDRMLKHYLQIIIREINKFLGYEKTYKKPRKEIISKGLVFHELRYVNTLTFRKFFKLYKKSFFEEQQDPESLFKSFLPFSELKVDIKEGATRTHLVLGILEGKVAALTYYSVNFVKERRICYGVGWYRFIAKDYRRIGIATKLHQDTLRRMRNDAIEFGVNDIDAMFVENNDPEKMKEQGIKPGPTDIDPNLNMELLRRMGFYKMRYKHIQPPTDDEPVTYSIMMIKPFNKNWIAKQGIPLKDMELVWKYYVAYGYEDTLKTRKVYREVIENMRKSQIDGYVTFGWW